MGPKKVWIASSPSNSAKSVVKYWIVLDLPPTQDTSDKMKVCRASIRVAKMKVY